MSDWTDKIALITGGSRGLGRALAAALLAAGARVTIAARDQQQLVAAATELRRGGGHCDWAAADITQPAQVAALITHTIERHGRLDLLIHCAGQSDRGLAGEVPLSRFRELLELNFLAAVSVTQAALPHLLATRGHVVLIGSLASKISSRHLGAYPASKFPLAAFAQQLRLELGSQGLHCLLVCPGPIRRDDAGKRYDAATAALPASARQPGGGVKLKGIDPDWLAARILRACQRREFELVVPLRAKVLFALAQLSPRLGDWLVTQFTSHNPEPIPAQKMPP